MTELNEIDSSSSENDINLNSLQKVISSLQEELQMKDLSLVNVTREKDRLQSEVKKYKRLNINLKQQLEDERAFYLKEKEYYCKEMSVTKKFRKQYSEELTNADEALSQIKETEFFQKEINQLKNILSETLEANYNLSIKFLRMKNTKYSLKARLKREQTENAKIISDLTVKLETARGELNHIISDKFRLPIPPSNKRYLQVVKQNTQLMHDNLNYQIQISQLYNDIERIKAEKIKHETNLRLQYSRKLKLETKQSCDKICEVDLCHECKTVENNSINTDRKSSNTTISSDSKDFQLFSDRQFAFYQKEAIRTQSAPECRQSTIIEE